jgi:hypothetical protein
MPHLRRRAAHRPRRIIYDNDGCDVFEATEPTAANLLAQRMRQHAVGHVDSVSYCTTAGGLGMVTHNTQIGQVFTDQHVKPDWGNITAGLIEQGTDSLAVMVEFCRSRNLEIFFNLRMNDIHDSAAVYRNMRPAWKREHPERLFGTEDNPPPEGHWSGADYSFPQVRQLALDLITEACGNYDVDGVILDFQRHPPYFRRVAWGDPVAPQETGWMTELMRRIRAETERTGVARQKPVLVGVRVLGAVDMNAAQGLDIGHWLKNDLVDLVVPGWVYEAPVEEMVQLGRRYDVPVCPQLYRGARGGLPEECAQAMRAWHAGADGLYLFNYFAEKYLPLFSQVGEPHDLCGQDKIYSCQPLGTALLERFCPNALPLIHVPVLSPKDPIKLDAGQTHIIPRFLVGDDVLRGVEQHIQPRLQLRIQVEHLESPEALEVRMNARLLSNGRLSEDWLTLDLHPGHVRQGNNGFEITVARSTAQIVLRDLQVHIRYRRGD